VLCSTFPLKNTDEGGIKAKLEAYRRALEGCDANDLKSAVDRILQGDDKMKWSPSAPELVQLVRDAKARRDNSGLLTAAPKQEAKYSAFDATPSERRTELAEYARKVAAEIGEPLSPEEWQRKKIKDCTIKPYTG